MQIKAVIFDRDGVLTYFAVAEAVTFFQPLLPLSLEKISQQWKQWGKAVGFPQNLTEEKRFFETFWHKISTEYRLSDEARKQLLQVDYALFLRPFSDARPALLEVRRRRVRTAVLSNFTLASLERSLVAVNLADLVEKAYASIVIGATKPSLEAYEIASHSLEVLPEECLFFDDEPDCVEGGRLAGMHAYLVDRRRTTHAVKDKIVCDLTAIPEILANIE